MIFDITESPKLLEGVMLIPIRNRIKAQQFISTLTDKPLICEITEKKDKRSKDANAYAWTLMSRIAEAISVPKAPITKEDVYIEMVKKYSTAFTHVIIKPEAVSQFKATCAKSHMYVDELTSVKVNGKEGIQLRVYYGSSTYDTKQMSRLIDGIVSEAKELGIETETPDELARLKQEWRK
jgi:hypothetical protein